MKLPNEITFEYSNLRNQIIYTVLLSLMGLGFSILYIYEVFHKIYLAVVIFSIFFIIIVTIIVFLILVFRFGIKKSKIFISNDKVEVFIQDKCSDNT